MYVLRYFHLVTAFRLEIIAICENGLREERRAKMQLIKLVVLHADQNSILVHTIFYIINPIFDAKHKKM